jgi:hypothetical protein
MRPITSLAIYKNERPALSMLQSIYREEKEMLSLPTLIDTISYALRECLKRRGITFLDGPEDSELVPVVTKKAEVKNKD